MFYQVTGNNPLLYETTDVIDTFVVRSLLQLQDVGMSSAAGLMQSVINFSILVWAMYSETASKGGFYPLTMDMIQANCPLSVANLPESAWSASSINGSCYIIPRNICR